MYRKQRGVTLIELMIVVAIVAILAAIAYPGYRNQMMRSHRAEAKAAVLQVQVAQEKFFLQNNSYSNDLTTLGLGYTSTTPNTTNGYYQLTLSRPTTTTYSITADTNSSQADDTSCDKFVVDQSGSRTSKNTSGGGSSGCW